MSQEIGYQRKEQTDAFSLPLIPLGRNLHPTEGCAQEFWTLISIDVLLKSKYLTSLLILDLKETWERKHSDLNSNCSMIY